jgi:D-xylose transport system substrate-binding protein
VVVAGLILWQTGLFTPSPAGTPGTKTAATPAVTSLPGTVTGTPSTADSARPGMIQYTALEGDTLDTVAAKFNVTVDEITSGNNLQKDTELKAGQELFIPLKIEIIGVNSTPGAAVTGQPTATAKFTQIPTLSVPANSISKPVFSKGEKIGLSLPNLQKQQWKDAELLLHEILAGKGYEVITKDANNDPELQKNQIASLVDEGAKGIIIAAEDGKGIVPQVEKAVDAGVMVIAYDRLIYSTKISAYLSFDQTQIGFLQADAIIKKLDLENGKWTKSNPAKIVLLGGDPTENNAIQIRLGQTQALQKYIDTGIVKIVADQWVSEWDYAHAQSLMENIITALSGKIDAVVASDDGTALGSLVALKSANIHVPISGAKASADGCNSILKDELTVTILNDSRKLPVEAYGIMENLLLGSDAKEIKKLSLSELTGETDLIGTVPVLFVPSVSITKDNIYCEVVKSGYQNYDDVYRDLPANLRPSRP